MGDSKPPQRQASQAERPQLWRTDGPRIGGGRQRPAPESAPALSANMPETPATFGITVGRWR